MIVEIGDELVRVIADEINPREDCQVSVCMCILVCVCEFFVRASINFRF